MRVLLVVALLVCVAYADFHFTGSFLPGSPVFNYPDSSTVCAPSTSTYNYQQINTTFATAGIRQIQAHGYSTTYLYVYRSSFNPTNGCLNLVPFSDYRYASGNNADDGVINTHTSIWLEADTYVFVIAGSSTGDSYIFGVNILDANITVQVDPTFPIWRQPYLTSSSTSNRGNATFAKYVFTAPADGHYDVGAFSFNSTSDYNPSTYIALLSGTPTDAAIYGIETSSDTVTLRAAESDEGEFIYYVSLTGGQQYTLVASDDNNLYNVIGFFVRHTHITVFTPGSDITTIFTQPERSSNPTTCEPDDDLEGSAYGLKVFEARGTIAFGISSDSRTYNAYANTIVGFDFATYLYSTSNTIPVACPGLIGNKNFVSYADSGIVKNTNANYGTHTLIVSQYYSSTTVNAHSGYLAFIFAGQTIGAAPGPVTTTGGQTATTSQTTGATTSRTTGLTTGTTSSVSTGNSTRTTTSSSSTTTSSASQVVAHLFALFAMLLVVIAL